MTTSPGIYCNLIIIIIQPVWQRVRLKENNVSYLDSYSRRIPRNSIKAMIWHTLMQTFCALNKTSIISSWTGIKKLSLSTFKTLLTLLKYPVNKSSSQRIKTRNVLRKAESIWRKVHKAHCACATRLKQRSLEAQRTYATYYINNTSQNLISRHLDQIQMYDSSFKLKF